MHAPLVLPRGMRRPRDLAGGDVGAPESTKRSKNDNTGPGSLLRHLYRAVSRSHAEAKTSERTLETRDTAYRHPGGALCVGVALLLEVASAGNARPLALSESSKITVDWNQSVGQSRTELTVQVCFEPPMRRGSPIHRQVFDALRALKMSYARLQPWSVYPKLSVAELDPPANHRTSWDFSLMDPIILDSYAAAEGRPIGLDLAMPEWLFTGPPPAYPKDPDEIAWLYMIRPVKTLRDPTFEETAAYFSRVAQWYIRGGFTDEYGQEHLSGHHLKIDYWEVLNEIEENYLKIGHGIDPQMYTALYDAIVIELQKVDPVMKYSALALGDASSLQYFEYFLNAKNHKTGIPLDMVSYHGYLRAQTGATVEQWQRDMFDEADRFGVTMRKIQMIRDRLSPSTKTFVSEFGFQWGPEAEKADAGLTGAPTDSRDPRIPKEYWDLAGSVIAYVYLEAIRAGVDLFAASELVDYPGQMAGTNLIDWKTGEPNSVYRVVKLLHEQSLGQGNLVQTHVTGKTVEAQAFETPQGRRLWLINKTREPRRVRLDGSTVAVAFTLDPNTHTTPRREELSGSDLVLQPHAVVVLSWPLP